jgi:uncharacterized protein YbjQ (UPF0145 family)
MIITTTPTVEGRKIGACLGVVTGEAIMGAHIGRDVMASITDIMGGRSAEYEQEVRKAQAIALKEMESEAERQEADAVVGVDLRCGLPPPISRRRSRFVHLSVNSQNMR